MSKTLLCKLTNLDQYKISSNNGARQLDWKSEESFFKEISIGDSAIGFTIQKGKKMIKALIGIVSAKDQNTSIVSITNVTDFDISSVDKLMRLNSLNPEQIPSTVAGYFQYRVIDYKVDIEAVKSELSNQQFIDFFILRREDEFDILKPYLKASDRVAIFDGSRFKKLSKFDGTKLVDFNDYTFCVDQLTLDEMIDINETKSKKENVRYLKTIKKELENASYHKFSSFTDYQIVLLNKTAYGSDSVQLSVPNTAVALSDEPITKKSLNLILFGPPGTGKTYNSINLAVEIADPEFMSKIADKSSSRATIVNRYRQLAEEGRIVFTTFHQSMSYEDFIEGIKPVTTNKGDVVFEVVDGIFKRMCLSIDDIPSEDLKLMNNEAELLDEQVEEIPKAKAQLSREELFDKAYEILIADVTRGIKENGYYSFKTMRNATHDAIEVSEDKVMKIKRLKAQMKPYDVPIEILKRIFTYYKDVSDVQVEQVRKLTKDIKKGKKNVPTYWAIAKDLYNTAKSLDDTQGKDIEVHNQTHGFPLSDLGQVQNADATNFVLIIDEINRGNVSQIFGELITLIEPDKRAGNSEALEVTLPYSKEKFSVPSNLYIIGTMNTADRSVEALDTALRRRFSFCEMTPEYELLKDAEFKGISLKVLLETINLRIEGLLDKDHAIGHSYFLKVSKGECTLKDVFFNEIIPLLQEYFYGNYGRIELVLGRAFVKTTPITLSGFAKPSPNNSDFNDHDRYTLVRCEEMDDDAFLRALRVLMNKSDEI